MTNEYRIEELVSLLKNDQELKGDEYLEFINVHDIKEEVNNINNSFIAVIDLIKMSYQYVSPNIKTAIGFSVEDFMNNGVKLVFDNYHPDTLMTQKAIHKECTKFLDKLKTKDKPKYRFCYDVRLKHLNGNFIRFLQRNRFLMFDDAGKPMLVLVVCNDITEFRTEQKQTFLITKVSKGKETIVLKKEFYPEYENGILTRKETEVWKMVSEGYKSKEIAIKLDISPNTVLTHRKRIIKKLKLLRV
jgi:hypothetical protein